MTRYLAATLLIMMSGVVAGETIIVDATGHYVRLNDPDMIDLKNDDEAYHGYLREITVTRKDGKTETRWCTGTNVMDGGDLSFGAGYCTTIDEDGDAYWTWFTVRLRGGFDWRVMGGTGKYEGATGSGQSTAIEMLPDGSATLAITGTIELASD